MVQNIGGPKHMGEFIHSDRDIYFLASSVPNYRK